MDHVVSAVCGARRLLDAAGDRPDEELDEVLAARVNEHRHAPSVEVVEPAAQEWKSLCHEILDRRREIKLTVEPGLHGMLVRRHDVQQMPGLKRPDMVIDECRDRILTPQRQDGEEDRRGERGTGAEGCKPAPWERRPAAG